MTENREQVIQELSILSAQISVNLKLLQKNQVY